MLPPRTEAAIRSARAAGIRVVIVTGRMFVSVRPYVLQAGIDDPVVCYQGAVVAEPGTGRWLRHEPIPVALAKEAIEAIVAESFHVNVYVDDYYMLHVWVVDDLEYHADVHAPMHPCIESTGAIFDMDDPCHDEWQGTSGASAASLTDAHANH